MRKSVCYNSITLYIILICCTCVQQSVAQEQTSLADKIIHFPDKVFSKIDKQAASFEEKINRQTEHYLNKLEKQEQKLKRKLWKTDSNKAKELFGDIQSRYNQLREELKAKQGNAQTSVSNTYNGHMDSVNTAIRFIQSQIGGEGSLPSPSGGAGGGLTTNLQSVTNLQSKLNQTELIRKQIAQRQQQLKQQLQNTPLMKEFTKYRKQVYYYQQQVIAYKEALNDPKQLGAKLLQTAMKFPAFQQFFANNSELAALFPMPGSPPPQGGVGVGYGLQTRADVMQDLQNRFGAAALPASAGGTGGLQQQIQGAQQQVQQLQNKVSSWNSGDELEMPDYKVNDQKTKPFLKRIELGSNMQTVRGSRYFPVTSDIGLSAGYKLNDKSVIGIGASYKLGWGQGWENIKITHQGAGLRSFVDIKAPFGKSKSRLLGSLWISGGAEMNYRTEFRRIEPLKNYSAWQQSALLGVTKTVDIKSKFFKKTKMQVLYDFLWKQQPQGQRIVFRVGYNF
jgi:hypothetical protein